MLIIDLDVADTYVSSPGFSLSAGVSRLPMTVNGVKNEDCRLTADGSALLMMAYQFRDDWASQPKFKVTDYSFVGLASAAGWEEVTRRGSVDTFLQSVGPVTGSVTRLLSFPRNVGFFVEAWMYAPTDQSVYDLFDMSFGRYFSLYVRSDGSADLFDTRVPGSPVASGNLSGGRSISGKFVQIEILPFRRTQIIISSNMGGFFVASVGSTLDTGAAPADWGVGTNGVFVITESGPVSLYNSSTPPAATFCFSVLQYPLGTSLVTPAYPSYYPITSAPTLTVAQGDQEMGTQIVLTNVTNVSTSSPSTSYQFAINMLSSNGSQAALSSAAIFANLYTPFDYLNRIDSPRVLASRPSSPKTIVTATAADMRLDKDRGKSTFSFTVDNPSGYFNWLKEIQNRRIRVYLDLPSKHPEVAANFADRLTDATDPDAGLIAANGGAITLFAGYTERVDYTDGTCSSVDIHCTGLMKKLFRCVLTSGRDWDGIAHTQAVREVLQLAGLVDSSEATGAWSCEIYVYNDNVNAPLPAGGPGSEPCWRPRDGVTASEFLSAIAAWSGWDLFEYAGVFYYMPKDTEVSALQQQYGRPVVNRLNVATSPLGGTTLQSALNCPITAIAALADPPVRESVEEIVANDIFVVGLDEQGNPLTAHYIATALMTDETNPNFVGDRWLYILHDASLATQTAVNDVCGRLAKTLTVATRKVEFTLPDYRIEFQINSPCTIGGYGNAVITGISSSFGSLDGSTSDRFRKTQYMADLV